RRCGQAPGGAPGALRLRHAATAREAAFNIGRSSALMPQALSLVLVTTAAGDHSASTMSEYSEEATKAAVPLIEAIGRGLNRLFFLRRYNSLRLHTFDLFLRGVVSKQAWMLASAYGGAKLLIADPALLRIYVLSDGVEGLYGPS